MRSVIHPRLKSPCDRLVCGLSLLAVTLVLGVQPAQSEGSRELVQNGGNRPYTEWRTSTTVGLLRRTLLKVYAQAGEVINIGSSGVGVGSGNAVIFAPNANVDIAAPVRDCVADQPGQGVLNTRAKEIAGPSPATGGYAPCTFIPTVSGVYQVAFYGPDGKNGDTDATAGGSSVTSISTPVINSNQRSSVSIWDITVRSSLTSTADLNGRVFTDYITMILGGNSQFLNSELFILTQDGYEYSTLLRGIDPYGFIFFANAKGLIFGGQPLYHSAPGSGGATLPTGVTLELPVHKTFFNTPSSATKFALSVPSIAIVPAPATSFAFQGAFGGGSFYTPTGAGGTFSFNAPQSGSYQIAIDTNNDGIFDPTAGDRFLEGSATVGANTVSWGDGKNGNGVVVPPLPGNASYRARILLKGGEYHFPLLDAETNTNGFTIKMLNSPGAFSNGASPTTNYFDEGDYTVGSTNVALGCIAPQVCDGRKGINSASGAHNFPTNYGDKKIIDTWIYFPSAAVIAPLVITPSTPNVRLVKRISAIAGTAISTYTDVITGAGAIDDNASGWVNPTATAVKSDNSGNTTNFSSLLQGAVTATALPVAQRPKPGDEVEYTIYFLSDGGKDASNVSLCDFVPANTTYVPGSIQLSLSGTLTAVPDGPALGSGFYPNSTPVFPASCMGVNNNRGAAVVSVGSAPKATASGTPTNSYGFFRFRAKVD